MDFDAMTRDMALRTGIPENALRAYMRTVDTTSPEYQRIAQEVHLYLDTRATIAEIEQFLRQNERPPAGDRSP